MIAPFHACRLRVRYGEVDRMGVVYHGHYMAYFEQGRTEWLRSLGATYREMEDAGTLLVVIETGVRHLKSAHYDDDLEIRTRLAGIRGVRLRFEYEIHRERDVLATGFTVLASADRNGRPCRPPASFVARLQAAGSAPSTASNAHPDRESA